MVQILECDDFESADDMAKALIKEVCTFLEMRDWYVLRHKISGCVIPYGMFAGEAAAVEFAGKLGGGAYRVEKVYSLGQVAADMGERKWKDNCQDEGCLHAGWAHLMEGSKRGACALHACPCAGFVK